MAYGDWAQWKRRIWKTRYRREAIFDVDHDSDEEYQEWVNRHSQHLRVRFGQPIHISIREATEEQALR